MAQIVIELGTSHGPMLSTPPDQWGQRVAADRANPRHYHKGRTYTFDALKTLRSGEHLERHIAPDVWHARHAACRAAIDALAEVFADVKPDIAVIVGNDQMEMFTDAIVPAFAVYWGETIENRWPSAAEIAEWEPGPPQPNFQIPTRPEKSAPGFVYRLRKAPTRRKSERAWR